MSLAGKVLDAKPTASQMMIGLSTLDTAALKRWAEALSASWNGKDDMFSHEGAAYPQEAAVCAIEIAEKCGELAALLDEMDDHV